MLPAFAASSVHTEYLVDEPPYLDGLPVLEGSRRWPGPCHLPILMYNKAPLQGLINRTNQNAFIGISSPTPVENKPSNLADAFTWWECPQTPRNQARDSYFLAKLVSHPVNILIMGRYLRKH
jgi:hypothetical protein